ncbi:LysM peptidoglycan-binding domain-containing protein [Deinococcus sp. KSM4-11]|uniref:C40 family peptidase n=1 Tax=Deinococcus sp. KSM4-11 TaxID=2568654 RepID=UPI0010A39BCF|nr:C40 family peptidase [Deinococcus sp. KSM4-11]THF84836.1 LysM peptidoglycan-binding domain-containing protein [Deinococcus sp. KSM4-11]
MPRPHPVVIRSLLLLALSLGAAAATAPGPVLPDPASTVTVQPGDTAYSIARRAGISVDTLLGLNGLSAPTLKVGQTLRVREVLVYTVQPGETLYALSRRYGVSVEALLYENALPPGATLKAGQALRIPARPGATTASVPAPPSAPASPPTSPTSSSATSGGVLGSPFLPALPAPDRPNLSPPSKLPTLPAALLPPLVPDATASTLPVASGQPTDWLSAALSLLGTPYVYGGASRSGTDCSGLVVQVFTPLGMNLPRTSAAQALVGDPVESGQWQPGDLVFFDTDGQGHVSHVGIYLGDDAFVDANTYQGKVVVDHLLGDRYWAARYMGARRVLPVPLAMRP